jgi:hypothetical protein
MRTNPDRNNPLPPRVQVQFESWEEWDEYVDHVAMVGGKLGPYGRIVLLKDARTAKALP